MRLFRHLLIRERFGQPQLPSTFCRSTLAWCLSWKGEFTEAITLIQEATRIAQAADHSGIISHIINSGGLIYLLKGDLDEAISRLELTISLNQANQTPPAPTTLSFLAHTYALAGRVAEALPLFEESLERAAAAKFLPCNSLWIGWWGEASLLAGLLKEAKQYARRAFEIARAQKEHGYEAYALRLLGKIAAHDDEPDTKQSETYYHQALDGAKDLGMRPLQAHCHLDLGTLYGKTKRSAKAHAELTTAVEIYQNMKMTFWLPQAEAMLAETSR